MTSNRFRPRPAASTFLLLLVAGMFAAPVARAAETDCTRPVADAIPLLDKMERSWSEVSDYTAFLVKTERFIDGTVTDERVLIKFRKPGLLYMRVLEGSNAGAELLYPKPGTEHLILARPGGVSGAVAGFLVKIPAVGGLIPYEFDLYDGRLVDGQHHPLPDSTLAGMIRLVSVNLRTAARRQEGSLCLHTGERVDGQQTTKIEVLFPPDVGIWHTVAEGESLWTIGRDYGQDRYVILYNNPLLDPTRALAAGERVFVPRYYAPRALVWISESLGLPVKLQMFDARGRLYESYSNVDLRVDVGLGDEDFDPVRYGFPAVTRSGGESPAADASSP